MPGHENISKFKKIQFMSSIFSDHTMSLEINYKEKNYKGKKSSNMWRLNNKLPNNQWITEEKRKYIIQIKMKKQQSKIKEMQQTQF